jgi:hypothetical protein
VDRGARVVKDSSLGGEKPAMESVQFKLIALRIRVWVLGSSLEVM